MPLPLAKQIGRGGREHRRHLRERIRSLQPDLAPDVVAKIASRGLSSVKRVTNAVEAINDNLITSTPEMIRSFKELPEYKKLIHWCYSLGAHSTDRVTREWKRFSTLVRWAALQSETEEPPLPQDFPGYACSWGSPKKLPPFWRKLVPWLSPVMERGVQSKAEATRIMHLCTSRNFPAGGKTTRRESLEQHSKTLHTSFAVSGTRQEILSRLSYLIGRQTKGFMERAGYTSNGHTSISSNASLDSRVEDGGRAAEIGIKFRSWLSRIPDHDVLETTWFGRSYWLKANTPVWQTMCRDSLNHSPHDEAGESDDRVNLDFENFKLEDPLYGLDDRTGYQLLQWSIEEGLRQGILVGSPYYNDKDRLDLSGRWPSIRPSAIGEPGAKSRVVTVSEDWLTMLLQPWAHHVIGALKMHPSAATGLTRGWQLYEWVKRQGNSAPPPKADRYYLSSDLKTATDFCTHEYSQAMLEGFHRGIERAGDTYFSLCARLLCSPRIYEGEAIKDFFDKPTTRAVLMGDPGAKAVLSLHNGCAESEAFLRHVYQMIDASDEEFLYVLKSRQGFPHVMWRVFAYSGDDHFGQGPKAYLQRITLNHSLNGMSVSWAQNFLSKRGGFYCEEMLLTVGLKDRMIWKRKIPLRDVPYLEQPHIDAMKIRLFSTCAKEHEGKDEPNPAIGKARQMHGMLAWLGGGWEVLLPVLSNRWEQRMAAFLPSDLAFRYLPVKLGGIEAPAYHLSKTAARALLRRLDEKHIWAIKQVLDGTATPMVSRVLATFATNARARGISSDAIEDQIRETLQLTELVKGVDDLELFRRALDQGRLTNESIGDQDPRLVWSNLRYKDKAAIAKQMRLLSVDEAIDLIGRPYLFRDMLYPEVSLRHGINPYRSQSYDNISWKARQEKFYENLSWNLPSSDLSLTQPEWDSTINRLVDWCVENKPLDIPRTVYFLPEAVVVHEKLATLRTPL